MRILLDNTSEIGLRAGHMLMGQESVDYVGVWRSEGARRSARSGPATDFDGYDVVVSDRPEPHGDLVARASVAGIPIVLWDDAADVPPGSAPIPIVRRANLAYALGPALASHLAASGDSVNITTARTEPGDPLADGTPVSFPSPVGPLYGRPDANGHVIAPFEGTWAGVSATTISEDHQRAVGVADHRERLEAYALAATGLAAGGGLYGNGLQDASLEAAAVFTALTELELDVAVWCSHQ